MTGVLVIALENATKLMQILLSSRKEYVALMNLHKDVRKSDIIRAVNSFKGRIRQLPPLKSAVARRVRRRTIYDIEILEIDGRNVLMRVDCEAGTYIRRLCDDIGKELGTGAHMQELRRTRTSIFSEDQAVTLQDLADAMSELKEGKEERLREIVLPMEKVTESMKNVVVKDNAIGAICNGAPLAAGGIVRLQQGIKKGDIVGMLSLKGELIAMGRALMTSDHMKRAGKGLSVKTDRVLMKKGVYPSRWR